jgi:hypothetical protein
MPLLVGVLAISVLAALALVPRVSAGAAAHSRDAQHAAAAEVPVTDIAKFVFEGLRARANSPECLKTPPAPECKEQFLGDVLRMFTSPTEKALAEISAKLDMISEQLKRLQSVVTELQHALDQNTYNNIVGFMRPEVIQQAMKTFLEVTQRCAKAQSSWPPEDRTFCETELGNGTRQDPGELRKQIREALINSGVLEGIPAKVSGAQGTTGILEAWPKVVKNRSDFFTVKSSKVMLDGLDYFYDLEMSAITLAVNYWRWEGRSETAIKADIDRYQAAVADQQKVYSALPAGVFIDVRSGLMWASSVWCSTYSRYGPRETGQCPAAYAGYPVTDQRLRFPGYPHYPYITACENGSWCMGTKAGVEKLLQGATQPWRTWLAEKAGVQFRVGGEADTWLVDIICDNGEGAQWGVRDGVPLCYTDRYYVNWDKSNISWSYLPDHNAAYYLFVRRPTERKRYY